MQKLLSTLSGLLLLAVLKGAPVLHDTIPINGKGAGRVFEGIGAVSAGASSRLLIDYPEPARSNILDYLFKPYFGAGFTYLKTEIGGDGNSTCGSEPSFARTREEMTAPDYNRGYEYWLMREAANRNPGIELDALEWTMPGWFNGVWSKDNADYLVRFIQGAQHWGLTMKYIGGCWNEREYNRNWIVDTLRPALDRNGLSYIKINAPEGAGKSWAIADELLKDSAFKKTLSVVSYHYVDSYMWRENEEQASPSAINCGLPLWSGEDFSLPGRTWRNTTYLAKNILQCYIKRKIVRVNMWCPIASMPENACFSNVGIMKATRPWSGYYEVWPTIWAVAHFNQFVKPGWQYLDDACGLLGGNGAYCTYVSPENSNGKRDYSIVIVSGSTPQQLHFRVSNLSPASLRVWKSDSSRQFIRMADIVPVNGIFTLTVDPESIYSVTTTTGASKGTHKIPAPHKFATEYSDDFEKYSLAKAPKSPAYFCDNSGAFELFQAPGETKCVRQVVDRDITHWIPDECAFTFVAQGEEWERGEISSDVLVEEDAFNGAGYAGVILRGAYDKASQANIPHGYRLNIYRDGTWKLQTRTHTLAQGRVGAAQGQVRAGKWHRLRLVCNTDTVQAFIDGIRVAMVKDRTYRLGAAGYTSGWNKARFDNLNIKYWPVDGELLSEWASVRTSSETMGNEGVNAVDGNSLSKWQAKDTDSFPFLVADLGRSYQITRTETFVEYSGKSLPYKIEVSGDGVNWKPFAAKKADDAVEDPCYVDKNTATGRWVRLTVLPTKDKGAPGVYELKVYGRN